MWFVDLAIKPKRTISRHYYCFVQSTVPVGYIVHLFQVKSIDCKTKFRHTEIAIFSSILNSVTHNDLKHWQLTAPTSYAAHFAFVNFGGHFVHLLMRTVATTCSCGNVMPHAWVMKLILYVSISHCANTFQTNTTKNIFTNTAFAF